MLKLVSFARSDFATLAGWFRDEIEAVQWGGPMVSYPITDAQLQIMVDETTGTNPLRLAWMVHEAGRSVGHVHSVLTGLQATPGLDV